MTQLSSELIGARLRSKLPSMRAIIAALVLTCFGGSAMAQTSLQALVDTCNPSPTPCELALQASTVYDDANPVYIRKDMEIYGPRSAVVHSEIQIGGGAVVRFNGFTLQMNKTGAPARTGLTSGTYPQNGFVVVKNATLYADDLEVTVVAGLTGYALLKNAFHVVSGHLELRAVTQFSRTDWRNSPYQVIELLYNSYGSIFDVSPQGYTYSVASGTKGSNVQATIQVASSRLIMSGSHIYNCANGCVANNADDNIWAVNAGRDSYVQVSGGVLTTIQYFTTPQGAVRGILLDQSSRQWCVPNLCFIS